MKTKSKLKLSKRNKNFFFLTFMKTKLFRMKLLSLFYSNKLLYKHANIKMKRDDTSFPQMGKEGCGSLYPACFLLPFTMLFDAFLPIPKEQGEKGKERRGKCFCLFALCLLLGLPLAFGLFLILLKIRALNTETLYVSKK